MKSTLLMLLSLFLPQTADALKSNSIRQSFSIVAQEVGIWVLVGGFVSGMFWFVAIILNSGLAGK